MMTSLDGEALSHDKAEAVSLHAWFERAIPRALAWLFTTCYQLTGDWRGWRPLLTRTSAHFAMIVVAVIAVGLSRIEWSAQAASQPLLSSSASALNRAGSAENAVAVSSSVAETNETLQRVSNNATTTSITRLGQPHTVIPDRPRIDVVTYTVRAGDTIQSIASQFSLEPTTIMWANSSIEDAPDLLRIGQEVTILPIDGVYHTVTEDDTLGAIADKYDVEIEAIISCQYNDLSDADDLQVGQKLIVPDGEKPYVPKVVTSYSGSVPEGAQGTGRFQWPVTGRITQGYWYGHRAIDLGAPTGSAVVASDGGFVSFAGWTDVGYGYLVVIDHANGFATYYAHLSNIYVFEGQSLDRGQVIGAVGNTGWSTGPHLHFEVRRNDLQQNPRAYLP
jgi:murein DD-endopeptidase MepM/ murein hydrolase activator NlpD